ncbi:HpcH/HpaI aldolase family protein [Paenibacillus sabuli]|uniref:HpcH/HpaI aldolase family protein n=1 Tax=Paenibacillus sabuli TaxID=2772509 RepID=UPI001CC2BE6B|nr:aldolase/citrate lyase family protein [Paenibacillus sabuli]
MSYAMRKSRVLELLRRGETVVCTKLNLADSRAAEIAALSGFDCVWTDMEHVANDWSAIERTILAAKVHQTDTIVRVARGGYSDYVRPLELDAAGIMVPHVMSAADAAEVVRHTKFHPLGLRPVDGGNADGAYCMVGLDDYMRQANEERFTIIQIEDVEPLEELEAIVSMPGIDIVFFGPGDFSQSIGCPGQMDHPLLLETRRRIGELAARHGKFAGTVGSVDNFATLVGEGYRFISVGADVVGLGQYYQGLMQGLRHVASPADAVGGTGAVSEPGETARPAHPGGNGAPGSTGGGLYSGRSGEAEA